MVAKEACIKGQQPPRLNPGEVVSDGFFLRNLKKKEEATKRYPNDDDENPVYGFKLSTKFFNNAAKNGDMSINESDCVLCEACSIAIHPHSSDYYHVAALDLGEINNCMADHPFVAQYDPIVEPTDRNMCHFELLPLNGSTQSLHALQEFLNNPFPPGKMPDGKKTKSQH